eukprot:Skav221215  [mRNA]  locus=scaffold2467:157567:158524:- [translate_table: standard]
MIFSHLRNISSLRVQARTQPVEAAAKMGKFLKAGRVVVMLQGRYAGKKAIVVKAFDDGSKQRPFGHCLVAGINRAPLKVTRHLGC